MKLLFDQNLAGRLTNELGDLFPGSAHVMQLGMATATDAEVWTHAQEHGFCIVSKDADFQQLSAIRGQPPKVIWLRIGNCSTQRITALLRTNAKVIHAFSEDPASAYLILS